MMYAAGLDALKGLLFITDSGKFIQIVDSSRWFEWNGRTRRIRSTHEGTGMRGLLETLAEAWPFDRTRNEELYAEARMRFEKAVSYDPRKDTELIIRNFDLLTAGTDRILSTPHLANGALGGLRAGFVYFGSRRFPISSLLRAWKEGAWIIRCDRHEEKQEHHACVLGAVGGLSMGQIEVYCPVCGEHWFSHDSGAKYFASIRELVPEKSDGYRLDEIIDELQG